MSRTRSPAPRKKRSKTLSWSSGGIPGPSSSTESTTWPLTRSTDASTAVPGSVWRSAFSIRFSASRCSSSRAPEIVAPAAAATVIGWPSDDRLELAGGLGDHARDVDRLVARDAPRVGARQQQQVRDQAAHPPRGPQRRGGRLALLAVQDLLQQLQIREHRGQRRSQLVRRVGDELALPRQRRLRLRARLVQRVEHPVQGPRQLGDLVLGLRMGDPARGVAGALDRARGLGQLGDRRHRAPRGRDARQQRQRGAAQHAQDQEEAHAVRGRLDVRQPPRVLDEPHAADRVDRDRPRLHAVAGELQRRRQRRGQVRRVRRGPDDLVVLGDDPDDRVLRGRVGGEVRPVVAQRRLAVRAPRAAGRSASRAGRRPRPPAG